MADFTDNDKALILQWKQIEDGNSTASPQVINELITKIRDYVNNKGGGITSTQLRNFYNEILLKKDANAIKLSRPKLAYMAARSGNTDFITLIDELVQKVDDNDKLDSIKSFFESIVAYHKYFHGDKEQKS